MQIVDGWATEYNRKKFSVAVDEDDWALWLTQNVLEPDGEILFADIPQKVKSRIMRLLAYRESTVAEAEWYGRADDPEANDPEAQQRANTRLSSYEEELTGWAAGLQEKFSVPAK